MMIINLLNVFKKKCDVAENLAEREIWGNKKAMPNPVTLDHRRTQSKTFADKFKPSISNKETPLSLQFGELNAACYEVRTFRRPQKRQTSEKPGIMVFRSCCVAKNIIPIIN